MSSSREIGGRHPIGARRVDAARLQSISSIATFERACLLSAARFPRPGYVVLRYADSPNCLIVSDGRRSVPRKGAFFFTTGFLEIKGCDHESEKPCSGLLSAHTFGAAPRFQAP